MTKPTKPFTPICEPAVLDRPNMAHFIGVSITTFNRLVQSGDFIEPIQISPGRVGYLKSAAIEWLHSRPVSEHLPVANCGRNQ